MAEVTRGQPLTWKYLGIWKDGALDLGETRAHFPVDDRTAGQLFADERPGELFYVEPTPGRPGHWYIWDGGHLKPDESGRIKRLITDYADRAVQLLDHAHQVLTTAENLKRAGDPQADINKAIAAAWEKWEPAVKYHHGLMRSTGHASLRTMLGGLVQCSEDHLADRHPGFLNFADKIVDLRTMDDYPQDPAAMMTYQLAVPWTPGASAPEFEQLVWHVSGENPDVARYLIRMLGYTLLCGNPDALIFFLNGPTASGKTVLLGVIADLLGALAHDSSAQLITMGRSERNARVENSIAGKRLIIITETSERMRIDEGQLKRLSDSGRISHHRHYAPKEIPTWITWTIWACTNEMPTLPSFDDAVRRRFRCIPAGASIPEHLRDKNLRQRITEHEGAAVMAMLVAGCAEYFRTGEQRPAEVELATAKYQSEQDTVAAFRDERTRAMNPNGQAAATVNLSEVYPSYIAWCQDTRTSPIGKHIFNERFKALPGIQYDEHHRRFLYLELVGAKAGSREESPWPGI